MPPFYATWQFWLLLVALLPWLTFVALYATRSPWYRWSIGRALMLSKVVIVAVIVNGIVGRIWPNHHFRAVVYVVLIGGSFVAGCYQLLVLLREQRRARADGDVPRRRASDFP